MTVELSVEINWPSLIKVISWSNMYSKCLVLYDVCHLSTTARLYPVNLTWNPSKWPDNRCSIENTWVESNTYFSSILYMCFFTNLAHVNSPSNSPFDIVSTKQLRTEEDGTSPPHAEGDSLKWPLFHGERKNNNIEAILRYWGCVCVCVCVGQ